MANNNSKLRKNISVGTVMRGTNKNSEFLQKLKDHLRVLFQFDSAELDFGIYRVMNYKRKEIENFIEDDLIRVVEKEFEKYRVQNQEELLEKIEKRKKEIRRLEKELGEKILKNGEIEEKFRDKPFAKEYTDLKKQIEEIDIMEGIQSQVFSDLYNFFSRYYEDGDFVSKMRYSSKQNKYAIPYSGEEVKLYWANFDQYYIKTGEIFKDYEFNHKGWKFIFRTVLADVEAGNVKGNRRYFFISADEPVKIANQTCLIKFEYRPLTNGDLRKYPVKTKDGETKTTGLKQDELNPILRDKILNSIGPLEPKAILNETQDEKTILEKHLHKYTRKITSDFFIHKNLKDFLERELDYFMKTEVLDIESLDTEKERYFDKHITRAKVVKNIGKRTIEFLSQIEEFQKLLWEKKKFVLRTDYVMTIDRIPEEFYEEVLKNKKQLKEWDDLGFGKVRTKKDLNRKKIPVDTKYFSEDFKERLLEKLSEKGNLDGLIDGILIKSENWQALNLILGKYKERVKCIYIDPPYNTGSDEFLYKDKYQHSSWLTMMYDRLNFAKEILKDDGVIFISIDDNEIHNLKAVMNNIFGEQQTDCIIWKKASEGRWGKMKNVRTFRKDHDYILTAFRSQQGLNKLREKPQFKYDYNNPDNDSRGPYKAGSISRREEASDPNHPRYYSVKSPSGKKFTRQWDVIKEDFEKLDKAARIYWGKEGNSVPAIKIFLNEEREITPYSIFIEKGTNTEAKKEFLDILGNGLENIIDKLNPKPEKLITTLGQLATKENSIVLDFFAGSGTTSHSVMTLNKKYNGQRKYILVEMADYFDTVIIPRLKKVCFSFNWKDGNPQDTDGISQFFKYHYLEQYEDTLHNIEFPQEEKGQKVLELLPEEAKTEYLMKYMLKFETEGSSSLLNLKQFESPFEYKLKTISNGKGEEIVNVDLVETFNYLIGLKVNKYKFLRKNGRKYVFVLGERNNRKTAIVWRPIKDIDLGKDKKLIDKSLISFNPDEIFINGDSFVKGYKPIESEFRTHAGV